MGPVVGLVDRGTVGMGHTGRRYRPGKLARWLRLRWTLVGFAGLGEFGREGLAYGNC